MSQIQNYEVLETIGVGSFGRVQKIKRKEDGKILVWKEMCYKTMEEREKQQLVSEVNILRDLKHQNIVRYYDRIIDKQNQLLFIIMEYCEGGDLKLFLRELKKNKECIPESSIWKIFMQIVLALHEIHRRKQGKVLHRDIKPANIFLDAKHNVKLGDFGLSKKLSQESQYAYTNVGTPYYMSPEQINENRYNEKSDIWSVGCLLYELCSLQPPFSATNHLALAMKIKNGKYEKIPKKYSNELWRVINWCLQKNHEQRPNVDDLLNLPEVSLRLREKRLKENQSVLQNREKEAVQKDTYLSEWDLKLKERENLLNQQELEQLKKLEELEKIQKDMQEQLNQIHKQNSAESEKYNSQKGNQESEGQTGGFSYCMTNNSQVESNNNLEINQGKNLKNFFKDMNIPKQNTGNKIQSANNLGYITSGKKQQESQNEIINPKLSYVNQYSSNSEKEKELEKDKENRDISNIKYSSVDKSKNSDNKVKIPYNSSQKTFAGDSNNINSSNKYSLNSNRMNSNYNYLYDYNSGNIKNAKLSSVSSVQQTKKNFTSSYEFKNIRI